MKQQNVGLLEFWEMLLQANWEVKILFAVICLFALRGLLSSRQKDANGTNAARMGVSFGGKANTENLSFGPMSGTTIVESKSIVVDDKLCAELKGLLEKNQKIEAIKRLREVLGADLKTAKTIVEQFETTLRQ